MEEDKLLKVSEIVDMVRVNPKTVYRALQNGELKSLRVGPKIYRVYRSELDKWLNRKMVKEE